MKPCFVCSRSINSHELCRRLVRVCGCVYTTKKGAPTCEHLEVGRLFVEQPENSEYVNRNTKKLACCTDSSFRDHVLNFGEMKTISKPDVLAKELRIISWTNGCEKAIFSKGSFRLEITF